MKIKEFNGTLSSIFSQNELENKASVIQEGAVSEILLPINKILPKKDQPRQVFNKAGIYELAESIRSKGIIQPIVVKTTQVDFYEIIVGERRWRAAKIAGLEKIPAVIRAFSQMDEMVVALIENIQREDLNPLEVANAINKLLEDCGFTHQQVAQSIGKSRSAVTNLLRLLKLETTVKEMLSSSQLELGHAKVLLGLNGKQQIEAAKIIAEKKLTVRESEKLISYMLKPKEKKIFAIDPDFEKKFMEWKERLSNSLSSKINCHFGKEGEGRVVIHFDSIEEATWLMEKISPEKIK